MARCGTTTATPAHGLWPRAAPFGLPSLFQAMGGAFAAPFTAPMTVDEDRESYTITIDVPGVKEDDLEVAAVDRIVTVRGRRAGPGAGSAFERTFRLPANADTSDGAITATLADGVPTVRAPKVLLGVAAAAAARAVPVVARGAAEPAAPAPAPAPAPTPLVMRAEMARALKNGDVEVKRDGNGATTYSFTVKK